MADDAQFSNYTEIVEVLTRNKRDGKETTFYVYPRILCKYSRMFEAAMRWRVDNNPIDLREHEISALYFDFYLRYVYDRFECVDEDPIDLFRCWIVADQLNDASTANLLLDEVIAQYNTNGILPPPLALASIFGENAPEGYAARRLITDMFLQHRGDFSDYLNEDTPQSFLLPFAKSFCGILADPAKPNHLDNSKYHVEDRPLCRAGNGRDADEWRQRLRPRPT